MFKMTSINLDGSKSSVFQKNSLMKILIQGLINIVNAFDFSDKAALIGPVCC